jgi:hypothetical protein
MNVLYNLKWQDGAGYPPGQVVADAGALFSGGIASLDNQYLGVIYGSDAAIQSAIAACSEYNMVGITDEEAHQFIENSQAAPTIQDRLEAVELLVNILGED